MSALWMLLAFLVMLGIALLFCSAIKVNIGEGILLSASAIVLLLYAGGKMGSFRYGIYALCVLAFLGVVLTAARAGTGKMNAAAVLCSPYLAALFAVFLYCLIAYYHDFIQHYDEWHQWALIVKYMARENALPEGYSLYMAQNPYAASLFHLFFQLFSGYSEAYMYVSAGVLMWIGFLLPFAGSTWKDWKKTALYTVILYLAIYSIYQYGMKNMYMDLPVIAWCGGLAGWWRVREKKRSNLLVAGCALIMACCFKWLAGPLIALFAALFLLAHTLVLEKGALDVGRRKRTLGVCAAVCAAGAAVLGVFAVLRGPALLRALTRDRLFQTVGIFLTYSAGKPLAPKSGLSLPFIPFLMLVLVLLYIASDLFGQKKEFRVYSVYLLFTAAVHWCILLYAYLFIFSYDESIRLACGLRYFALYADFVFVIALSWLFQRRRASRPKIYRYFLVGLLLFFLSGVNEKFIPNMTALDKTRIPGYEKITKTKKQALAVQKAVGEDARVYLLVQNGEDEYAVNAALYYLEEQVSKYLTTPWKFTEKGCLVWLDERGEPDITDFPQMLTDGGYTHVWIVNADDYLSEELPKVLECEDEVKSGSLYEVLYEDGTAAGLRKIRKL